MVKWQPGRQGTGYRKLPLLLGKTWDSYLIDYPVGSYVGPHRDPVEGKRHYRLNLVLRGGDAVIDGDVIWKWWKFVLFRPDLVTHQVRWERKRRVVLSIGWVR